MKIGIITFHRAVNFGALLQAYALQETILSLGAECEIIDYRNQVMENLYRAKSFHECSRIKDCLLWIINFSSQKKTHAAYEEFRYNYLKLSPKVYMNLDDLRTCNDEYDRIISGSDQVWNYRALNFDKNYFLDFIIAREKKYSYAASFGVDTIPEEYIDEYKRLFFNFCCLSVRERQGCNIIHDICGLSPELHIDPVFLLDYNAWEEKMECICKKDKYILVYSFELTAIMRKFIEALSRKANCGVFVLGWSFKKILDVPYKNIYGISPKKFIEYFINASYVVTNSFHGTAFSILFNKEFFVELLVSNSHMNSRIENILEIMSLTGRLITRDYNIDNIVDNRIEWDSVNRIVQRERQKSLSYLKTIIE